jgi:hypothetical protein
MRYQLYYWPMIQGRGEYVRLALEDAGAAYDDAKIRKETGTSGAILRLTADRPITGSAISAAQPENGTRQPDNTTTTPS